MVPRTPISEQEARSRAKYGAEFMDHERRGWAKKIDLGRFRIENCLECVLGQLFGSYMEGRYALKLKDGESLELGFDCWREDNDFLNAAWRDEIAQRL